MSALARTEADEGHWDRAKDVVRAQYPGVTPGSERFYKLTMAIWQRMSPPVAKAAPIFSISRGSARPPLRLVLKSEQLPLFGGGVGSIKHSPTNHLGVDRVGHVHWLSHRQPSLLANVPAIKQQEPPTPIHRKTLDEHMREHGIPAEDRAKIHATEKDTRWFKDHSTGATLQNSYLKYAQEHFDAVRDRLLAGDTVPAKVLADYPRLQSIARENDARIAGEHLSTGLARHDIHGKNGAFAREGDPLHMRRHTDPRAARRSEVQLFNPATGKSVDYVHASHAHQDYSPQLELDYPGRGKVDRMSDADLRERHAQMSAELATVGGKRTQHDREMMQHHVGMYADELARRGLTGLSMADKHTPEFLARAAMASGGFTPEFHAAAKRMAAGLLKALIPRGLFVLKAHVKQYTRMGKTGQQVVVHEHDDKRMGARPAGAAGGRRPPRQPSPQSAMRFATLHTEGPGSPGHTFRLMRHPSNPGQWNVHDGDRERLKQAMSGGDKQQQASPAAKQQPAAATSKPSPHEFDSIIAEPSSAYTPANPSGDCSQTKFKAGEGYTPERTKLHDAIIGKFANNVPQSARPTFYMTGGGGASGKGHLLKLNLMNLDGPAMKIDPDEIKKLLPEFREMKDAGDSNAANFAHEESADVSGAAIKHAASNKLNAIYDSVGDSGVEKLAKKVAAMRAGGHRVVAHYVTCDTDKAIKRAKKRAETPGSDSYGRFVPEDTLRTAHRSVSQILPVAIEKGLFDETTLWDTDDETQAPRKVMSATGSQMTIHDQDLWQKFLDKGKQ